MYTNLGIKIITVLYGIITILISLQLKNDSTLKIVEPFSNFLSAVVTSSQLAV